MDVNQIYKLAQAFEKLSKDWRKGKSKISGNGAFADVKFDKDDVVGLGFQKVKDTEDPDKDYTRTELGSLVNHSKTPNLKLHREKDKFYLKCIEDIDEGKELTIDYKKFPWEGKRNFE